MTWLTNLFRHVPRSVRQAPPENALDALCAELGGATYARITQDGHPTDAVGIVIKLPNGDSFASYGPTTAAAVETARVRSARFRA